VGKTYKVHAFHERFIQFNLNIPTKVLAVIAILEKIRPFG
jgi:hypothetical protein